METEAGAWRFIEAKDGDCNVEFPGFSGQAQHPAFRGGAMPKSKHEIPGEGSLDVRVHQGAASPIQRANDVSPP